ncbi:T-lymphocyte surface antigen Ly-9-like [Sphaerodactylus townsendi]|nr:T-lymphocyte surface antigen Ly-9-like [Sphaerodactylus townsendi]
MEIRGFWWVLLLLLLDRQSSETANITALNPPCYEVSGIQGGSVLLPTALTSSEKVAKIEWKFQPQTGLALAIAEFIGGKLERPNPGDRFGWRLKMVDEATLRITELELGDGGDYMARVRLASAVVEEHSFTCRVYEPVPEPQILFRLVSRTAEMCNVTLRCLGSEKGGINISWKRGDQLSFLEGSSDWYQLSAGSTDLHVSWRHNSSDSTFTCLLSNPVDQKSASFHLASICQNGSARSNPAENPPVQVNGILGGSASFPLKLPATTPVARIEWSLRAGSGPEVLIPELKVGRLEWQDTRERFGQRLEMADGTTLRIRALEKEDSCTLEARVVFASGEVLRKTFRLSVFEPVPDPEIHPHLVSRSTEVCNVTLHCLGSEKGGIDVSWKRGNSSDQLGVPEEGLDTDLHVSWQSSSLDSTFTCLLSNPADQKSASLDLASICRSEDGGHLMYMWILGLVAFLILVAGLGIWQWKKRPRPRAFPYVKE